MVLICCTSLFIIEPDYYRLSHVPFQDFTLFYSCLLYICHRSQISNIVVKLNWPSDLHINDFLTSATNRPRKSRVAL